MYLHRREMAETTNFTEDVLQKIKKELSCSPQYNPKVDNELKILSALQHISLHNCISGKHFGPRGPT